MINKLEEMLLMLDKALIDIGQAETNISKIILMTGEDNPIVDSLFASHKVMQVGYLKMLTIANQVFQQQGASVVVIDGKHYLMTKKES